MQTPYYAVIFVSRRTPGDRGYAETADRMEELAQHMPGYLGIDSARNPDGFGITVSYWADLPSIVNWREHAEHRIAQERGQQEWYESYDLHISRVEYGYSGPRQSSTGKREPPAPTLVQ